MTTVTESFPLTFAAALLLIGAFVGALRLAATLGTKRAVAYRESLRDATPAHDQSRAGEFDEHGRLHQ